MFGELDKVKSVSKYYVGTRSSVGTDAVDILFDEKYFENLITEAEATQYDERCK